VLTLGGKMISNEKMREIVRIWLSSGLTEERHRRRVAKIDALL
jgi:ribose 5-phosphate isomerase RpiB